MAARPVAELGSTTPVTAPNPAGSPGPTCSDARPRELANRNLRLAYLDLVAQAEDLPSDALRRRMHRKANETLSAFCESNDALVGTITRRYRPRKGSTTAGGDFADLEQVARLALLEAFHCWDPDQSSFAHWAWPRISGAVWREVAHQRGQNHRDFGRRKTVLDAESQLVAELGRRPSDRELAEFCQFPVDGVRRARMSSPVSLDAPAGDDTGTTLGDLLSNGDVGPVAEDRIDAAIAAVAEALSPIEVALFIRCLGVGDTALDGGPRQKVAAAGALFGLNRESARRRYNAAVAVAREVLSGPR
jgi:DNA-directed RNA polymerase specialized sigma subunit